MRAGFGIVLPLWLTLGAVLGSGCTGAIDDEDVTNTPGGGDDDATSPPYVEPTLDLSDVSPGNGQDGAMTITFVLTGQTGLQLDLTASYSTDGITYQAVTLLSGTTASLAASPTGQTHTVVWDSLSDLGYVDKKVYLRLTAAGGGVELGPVIQAVQISNSAFDVPCVAEIDPIENFDGDIPISYTLSDARGDTCSVAIRISRAGLTDSATPSSTGHSDPLEDVAVTAEGVTRIFTWDSLSDIDAFDETVTIEIVVEDANNTETTHQEITVENSPVPDPGEVVFTEVFFWNDLSDCKYLELINTASHPLNLRGLALSSVQTAQVLLSPDQDLMVEPMQIVVLAEDTTEVCKFPVTVANSTPVLQRTSPESVTLWRGEGEDRIVIDAISYSYLDYGGADPVRGHALALDWSLLNAVANNEKTSWCLEQELLPGGNDYGTPGESNLCSVGLNPEARSAH